MLGPKPAIWLKKGKWPISSFSSHMQLDVGTLFYVWNQNGQYGMVTQRFASTKKKGEDYVSSRDNYGHFGTLTAAYSLIFWQNMNYQCSLLFKVS
jgi:hypothetical protein